jgi:hypothetical protein
MGSEIVPDDTTYNPSWELTPETERYLKSIFNELKNEEGDDTVKKANLVRQVRKHSLLTEEEASRLQLMLAEIPDDLDYAAWLQVVKKWREVCPESIEKMWAAWVEYRLGPTLHLDAEMHIQHSHPASNSRATTGNGLLRTETSPLASPDSTQKAQASSANDLVKRMVAGGLAGMAAKTMTAPIDRIKILFQVTSRRFSFLAASNLFVHVCRSEGPVALWRGNNAQLLRVFPYAGIQFMCYDFYKGKIRKLSGASSSAGTSHFPAVENLLSGAFAGATSVLITYPLDCLRARLAVEEGKVSRFAGLGDAIKTMYAKEGVSGFYRGVTPTLLGILPYAGIAFAANDTLRARASVEGGKQGEVSVLTKLVCGGLSGLLAQSLTYPLDVIRRRQQTEGYVTSNVTANTQGGIGSGGGTVGVRVAVEGRGGAAVQGGAAAARMEGTAAGEAVGSTAAREVGMQVGAKVKMQVLTMRETAVLILKTDGPQGLFKGLAVNWVKAPVAIGVSFTLFDWFKEQFGLTSERSSDH